MAVRSVWLVLALSIKVNSEAPFSAREASEAAELLNDSKEESALEEAALAEAALTDDTGQEPVNISVGKELDGRGPEKATVGKVRVTEARPNLRGPRSLVHAVHPAAEQSNVTQAKRMPSLTASLDALRQVDGIAVPAPKMPSLTAGLDALRQVDGNALPQAGKADEHAGSSAVSAGPPSASTDVDRTSSGISSMEKMVTDMMLNGKSSFGATPFGKSVGQITDLIEKDMMPKVLAAHTANQRELDQLMKEVLECGKTKGIGVAKANKKKTMYLKMSPLHKTCRSSEAGMRTEKNDCLGELKDKRGLMNLKCKEFAFVSKKFGDQNANRQIVKKAGGEGAESYIRRMTATICGKYPPGGKGGGGKDGFLDEFMIAKDACEKAEREHKLQQRKCVRVTKEYRGKQLACDNLQDLMDGSACKRAVQMKDACETYAECYYDRKKVYLGTEKMVKVEEKDRQAEWRGLKRMQCLMKSFSDGKVSANEIETCKKRAHDVGHLVMKYPKMPKLAVCSVPDRYPTTAAYQLAEFAPLPSLAKGKAKANECTGVIEIPTKPNIGSPKTCKCERVTLNGPYSAGPLVKCSKCLNVRRSQERNSCPAGTKLFSPRSASDWKTVLSSVGELRDPYFIVDVTRPKPGCAGCTKKPMNSQSQGHSWHTSDGSPWWLRSKPFKQPSGNYQANCYLAMFKPWNSNNLNFDDGGCKFHAKSYYCQLRYISTTPKTGSPSACKCETLALTGTYSAGALLRCAGCLRVSRSQQKNSCPIGTKLFSPAGPRDWKTFLASAKPIRSPSFIIDVTRPQNGCGGCTKYAMHSKNPAQMTWRTSDGSPWWLRSSRYTEPSGDYSANCYLDLWKTPANENSIMFNDHKCKYNSNAYYCQPVKRR